MIRGLKRIYCRIASVITKRTYIVDVTGTILCPSKNGEKCRGNGEHKNIFGRTIECCCDECNYFLECYKETYGEYIIDPLQK